MRVDTYALLHLGITMPLVTNIMYCMPCMLSSTTQNYERDCTLHFTMAGLHAKYAIKGGAAKRGTMQCSAQQQERLDIS